MQRSRVDFPLPLGPTSPTTSPSATSMVAEDTMVWPSMTAVTPAAESLTGPADRRTGRPGRPARAVA